MFEYGVHEYDYSRLRAEAIRTNTHEALEALWNWFDTYSPADWNGESYDMDGGLRLFPVYGEDNDGDFAIVGYEIR